MKKPEIKHIVFGVAFVSAAIFVFLPDIQSATKEEESISKLPQYEPPMPVSVEQFSDENKVKIPALSEADRLLLSLEYQAKTAQLQASIAESENKKNRYDMEFKKDEAEISKIRAETERVKAQIIIDQLEADASIKKKESPAESPVPAPLTVLPSPAPTPPSYPGALNNSVGATPTETAVSISSQNVTVNRIVSGMATLTINGQMQSIRVGSSFMGVKLVSISPDNKSLVTQSVHSGKRSTINLSMSNSRRFAQLESFDEEESDTPTMNTDTGMNSVQGGF